jgi:hypothetical protein
VNTSVTNIDFRNTNFGDEGASALADALKVNASVTNINLWGNDIGPEGALALANALQVNTSVTTINLRLNNIGDEGASALADALEVNTSVANIDLDENRITDESNDVIVEALVDRNKRLCHLFPFDTRRMLLSLMCADECGVVRPYLLVGNDLRVTAAPANVETLRAEFAAVVEERRRRATAVERQVAALVGDKGGSRAVKRRRANQ